MSSYVRTINWEKILSSLNSVYIVVRNNSGEILFRNKNSSVYTTIEDKAFGEAKPAAEIFYDETSDRWYRVSDMSLSPDCNVTQFVDVTEELEKNMALENKLANAVNRAEMFRREKMKLECDCTTGLPVKARMMNDIEEYVDYAARNNEEYCILMCDIDKFKDVNDQYGHINGDEILHKVADALKENIRQNTERDKDIIGRFGGEEILILLKNVSRKESKIVGERLRRAIENTSFIVNHEGVKKEISLTISIGGCHITNNEKNANSAIKIADRAMYCSKNNGRNRTTIVNKPFVNLNRKTKVLVFKKCYLNN